MSEPTGETPNDPYAYTVFGVDLPHATDEEIMHNAQMAPPKLYHDPFSPIGDEKGYYDADGLYWYFQPMPTRSDGLSHRIIMQLGTIGELGTSEVEWGVPGPLTDITIESTLSPEDIEDRIANIRLLVAEAHARDIRKGAPTSVGLLALLGIDETEAANDPAPQSYQLKAGVTPAEVVDWVRSVRHGENIIVPDRLTGYEPDQSAE